MSKTTKRKHVTKEAVEDYYVPEDGEEIVKIIAGRGNNLHEVVNENGTRFLVSMPTKFRRNIWVKRGDFVIMSPIKEGKKVQGEIIYILLTKQIKYLKREKLWPQSFGELVKDEIRTQDPVEDDSGIDDLVKDENDAQSEDIVANGHNVTDKDIVRSTQGDTEGDSSSESESSDDDDELFENPNRRPVCYYDDEDTEDSSSNEEEEDSEGPISEEDEATGKKEEPIRRKSFCSGTGLEGSMAQVRLK